MQERRSEYNTDWDKINDLKKQMLELEEQYKNNPIKQEHELAKKAVEDNQNEIGRVTQEIQRLAQAIPTVEKYEEFQKLEQAVPENLRNNENEFNKLKDQVAYLASKLGIKTNDILKPGEKVKSAKEAGVRASSDGILNSGALNGKQIQNVAQNFQTLGIENDDIIKITKHYNHKYSDQSTEKTDSPRSSWIESTTSTQSESISR